MGAAVALLCAGCSGAQSTLAPAGAGAEAIARVFWVMVAGALVVWLLVVAGALWAGARRRRRPTPEVARRRARWLVVGGGMVAPTLLLGALLAYGLLLMPKLREPPPAGGLEVAVSGEQWWWRVRYAGAGGGTVETANEIHLPVGERIRFLLDSPDVIHAFWVPALGGKVDMIPGRTTELVLEPTRTGVFEGICAEFCGTSHAFMRFTVVVSERPAFEAWLRRQAAPAAAPVDALASAGRDAFFRHGCQACHAVRGTPAAGTLGPDLTHVGGRRTLAAGVLPNDPAGFRRWIAHTHAVKPDALMPEFGMLPEDDVRALATWLEGLQ